MATIKSYTSLEQSKKLAEILPLESADMHYNVVGDAIIGDYRSGISSAMSVAKAYKKNPDEFAKNVIPCWSLAALLDILNYPTLVHELCGSEKEKWFLSIYDPDEVYRVWENDPIDACYEMILKLNEQNLL